MKNLLKLTTKVRGIIFFTVMIAVISALTTNSFSVFNLPVAAATIQQEIVFIDSEIKDIGVLEEAIRPGVEVILLSSEKDGVTQIAEALEDKYDVDVIHIISHGEPGKLSIGKNVLSNENLDCYSQELGIIGDALADDGNILLYGCNVAADSDGKAFVNKLAKYTGSQICASSDLTGNTAKGGDWDLEYKNKKCDIKIAFNNIVNSTYQGLLGDVTLSPDEGSVGVSYGAELTSGEAGSAIASPGVRIYYTDSISHTIAGEVATFDTSFITGCNGIGIFHSKVGDPTTNYWNEPNMTEYMIINKTDNSDFNFKEMQVTFAINTTLVIEGFKDGVSTGTPIHYVMDSAITEGKMITFDSTILTPSQFQNVDEVRVTGMDYADDVTNKYDNILDSGFILFRSFTLGDPVLPDITAPTLLSAIRNSNTQITVTLSENCSGLTKLNNGGFTVSETGTPGTTYAISSIAQGVDASHVVLTVADMGISAKEGFTVTYTAGANGTIQDVANNALATDGTGVTIAAWDVTAPTVSSINRDNPVGASTNATSVVYRVTFNEAVTGVDINDFTLTTTGTAAGSIASVSASSGTSMDVTINSISGVGTLRLDLNATGTGIADVGGTPIETGYSVGQIYTIDTDLPTLQSAVRNNNTQITVALSEDCVGLVKANNGGFTVSETGTPGTTYAISSIAQGVDASHVVLTVADMGISAKEGVTVTYTAGANGTIQDVANNALATDGTGVTIAAWDVTAPTVSSINQDNPVGASTNATSVVYRVTFNEAVTGVDINDFTLTTTGTAAGSIASVSASSGTTMDVTVNSITGVGTLRLDLKATGTGIVDVGGTAIATGYSVGQIYTIDTVLPTLQNAVRNNNTQITVALSEDCVGLVKANNGGFTVSETGTPGTLYAVSSIAQGVDASHVVLTVADMGISAKEGITVTYTAGANGTIQDVATNALATDGTGVTIAAWDVTAPTVSSINRNNPVGASTNATSVVYRVTFNEAVTGVDINDFTLTTTGTAAGSIASVSASSGTTMDVTVNSITGVGTLRLDLKATGTGIVDVGGSAIATGYSVGQIYAIDTDLPTLQSAVRNSNTQITVALSEDCVGLVKANNGGFTVSETGTPGTLYAVSSIAQGVDASHVVLTVADMGISAKEGITVTYTAGANGTIQDVATNALATDGTGVMIAAWDVTAPTVSSINRNNPVGASTNATSVVYRVTFNEAVTGVDINDFTLTTTGTVAGSIASVSASSGTTMDVTVNSITGVGTLRLDLKATGTGIADVGGTAIATGFSAGQIYTIDTDLPTLQSAVRNSNTQITVALSENCVNLAKLNDGGFTVSETGTPGTTYAISSIAQGVDASHVVLTVADMGISAKEGITVTYTAGANGTIQDVATNALATDETGVTIAAWDVTAPTVSSINRNNPVGASTNATSVVYRVTFNEAVTGVDINDFTLTATGTVAGSIASVSASSGTSMDVIVNSISGVGTLRLDLKATGTGIADVGGTAIATGYSVGQIYTIDTDLPTLQNAVRNNNTQITVALSENCVNLAKLNNGGFTVSETGTPGTTYAISSITQGIDASHVVLTVGDMGISAKEGITVTYTAGANGTIQDVATNALATDGTGVMIAAWDVTAPTVSSINPENPVGASTNATSVVYRVTFNEAVTGVDINDFTLTTTGTVAGSIASVSASSETSMDVTVNSITGVGTLRLDLKATGTGIADVGGTAIATGFSVGQIYTIDTELPTLMAGSVTRTSNTTGTVKFTASENGNFYYVIVADGAVVPVIDTSGAGTVCTTAETTITNPSGLSTGKCDLYVVVKDLAGNISSAIKIDIDEYIAPPSTITPTTPIISPTIPDEKTEQLNVDVTEAGSKTVVSETIITRTTDNTGAKSDKVEYLEDKAKETVNKLKESGKDTARIVIPDAKDEVVKAEIIIPKATISIIGTGKINLEIDTENARISIPTESIQEQNNNSDEDLYFRVVPIKQEIQRLDIETRVKQEPLVTKEAQDNNITVVGRPMTIETNMSKKPVDIILPLKDIVLPTDEKKKQAFLNGLSIFIEHSDGDKELVKGEVVVYKDGVLGLKFRITKFSTFTIVKVDSPKLSNATKVSSVKIPKDSKISGTKITAQVTNSTKKITINVNTSDKATWNLYSDKATTKKISKTVSLKEGKNTFYMKVTAEDGTTIKIYTITITRKKSVPVNLEQDEVKKVVLVATDRHFADSFAGEVLAKKLGGTVMLIGNSEKEIQKVVSTIIKEYDIDDSIYIFGLSVAVKNDLETILKEKGYKNIIRIGGEDKYETAKKIAENINPKEGTTVVLVNGDKMPQDGDNIKKLCAEKGYPILFVKKSTVSSFTLDALKNINPNKIYIVGDEMQIQDKIVIAIMKRLGLKEKDIIRVKKSASIK